MDEVTEAEELVALVVVAEAEVVEALLVEAEADVVVEALVVDAEAEDDQEPHAPHDSAAEVDDLEVTEAEELEALVVVVEAEDGLEDVVDDDTLAEEEDDHVPQLPQVSAAGEDVVDVLTEDEGLVVEAELEEDHAPHDSTFTGTVVVALLVEGLVEVVLLEDFLEVVEEELQFSQSFHPL